MAQVHGSEPGSPRAHRGAVGRLVEPNVPRARPTETVADVRARLGRERFAAIDVVLVLDGDGRLSGVVGIADLLAADGGRSIEGLRREAWPIVAAGLDQERAVEIAAEAGVSMLPVVDRDGRPLGCMPAATMLRVLAAEHREDVQRMAGILENDSANRHALEDAPAHRFLRRLPWLVLGLGLSSAGTAVMAGFEATLQRHVAVAFFIPALVYLTDAIGTQTEAIAVRGLPVTRKPFLRILAEEVATGVLIGSALGLLAALGILAVFGDLRLALAVGLSLAVAGAIACAVGLFLPWALGRLGSDPALGSGPVATIIQDVLTLVVYFVIVTAMLRTG